MYVNIKEVITQTWEQNIHCQRLFLRAMLIKYTQTHQFWPKEWRVCCEFFGRVYEGPSLVTSENSFISSYISSLQQSFLLTPPCSANYLPSLTRFKGFNSELRTHLQLCHGTMYFQQPTPEAEHPLKKTFHPWGFCEFQGIFKSWSSYVMQNGGIYGI